MGLRRSWVGRPSEVGWVPKGPTIEGERRGWRVLRGSGMPTRVVKMTKLEMDDEEHQCGGPGLVYHDSGRP